MRAARIAICILVLSAGCLGISGFPEGFEETETEMKEENATPSQPMTSSSTKYNVDVEGIEDEIHKKMNSRRKETDRDPLTQNETLGTIARYKSWDMAQNEYFAHTGENGTTHAELRDQYTLDCKNTGQNIYKKEFLKHQSYPYPQSELSNTAGLATDAVNSLLNSPGHRENALSPHYDSQGIGVFVDENGTVFVTQEFCG